MVGSRDMWDAAQNTIYPSKGGGAPKKCSHCQKAIVFKSYRCKHCRHRCHKRCAGHSRRSSCHKQYAGEEHWTKVLQASEVNSNLVALPGERLRHHSCCEKSRHGKCEGSREGPGKETNIFSTLYERFCQWVASTKKEPGSSRLSSRRSSVSRSRSGSRQSIGPESVGYHDLVSMVTGNPEEVHRCYHTSVSSEDSEYSSFHLASMSSTCSSLTVTSCSTAETGDFMSCWSDRPGWAERGERGRREQAELRDSALTLGPPLSPASDCASTCSSSLGPSARLRPREGFKTGKHRSLDGCTSTDSAYSAGSTRRAGWSGRKHPSVCAGEVRGLDRLALCDTWPPSGRRCSSLEESTGDILDDHDLLDESVFDDFTYDELSREKTVQELRESLGDCTIPYTDLAFGEIVREGRRHVITRGRWHGDVMVHTFKNLSDVEVTQFWSEVSKLSMIRHENVALFMGACLEPPNLAVVTSVLKGQSLYERLHLKSEKLGMHTRVNTVRQVAQGMGYLHARGIVVRKLNSKNVYLEPKVKICLMDYSMTERKYDRPGLGCVPRGNLCYVAPEILRYLRVVAPRLEAEGPSTAPADVFAFGTVTYELLTGQFPFLRTPPACLIWQVASGRRQNLKHVKCNSTLKMLIERCWHHEPDKRPEFTDINKELQHNTALHKRHSSSEPERMNRCGLNKRMFP